MQELLFVTVLFSAFAFLALSFAVKKWPVPLISFILFLTAGVAGMNVQNTFCVEVIGAIQCQTQSTFNYEMPWLAGAMCLLCVVLLFIRIMRDEKPDDKDV